MHILFVNPYYFPYIGGVEKVIDKLGTSLLQQHYAEKISILTTYAAFPSGDYSSLPSREVINGKDVYRINFAPKKIFNIYHSYNAGFYSSMLRPVLKRIAPDIVHYCKTEWFIPNWLTYQCLKGSSRQIFFSAYHEKPLRISHSLMRWFNKFLFNKMDALYVPSRVTAIAVSKAFDVSLPKISVIPLGASIRECEKDAKTSHIENKINIICVGRLGPHKGQYQLLKELVNLSGTILNKLRLRLVGNDGGDLANIQALITQKSLSFVQVLTNVNDQELAKLYNDSDIFVSCSAYESFGLSIVEALGFGLPVVAFCQGAISELNVGGIIMVQYPDWTQLCQSIITLANDEEKRRTLGEIGRSTVRENYSWEAMAKRVYQIYMTWS